VAELEKMGLVTGVITQNVDRLHHAAGSKNVVELHGTLETVSCLSCSNTETREQIQHRIGELNPDLYRKAAGPLPIEDEEGRLFTQNGDEKDRLLPPLSDENCQLFTPDGDREENLFTPDGDVEIPEEYTEGFRVPACLSCGGILKPDVVFFGDSVPKDRVERCWKMVQGARSLLVLGSTLTVFSGFRFVKACASQEKPIIIINRGETRADELATVKVDATLGEVLPSMVAAIKSVEIQ
jgi:NAD-dependent SIR2 family protein deacetylase